MSGTYVSLFSGIGGLDLAVEAVTGWRCIAQVEWDPVCARVLDRHWPGVPRWGDVRGFPGDAAPSGGAERFEPPAGGIDLICGGFPCQPASTAGSRLGVLDERWLWPEFARVVRELGPRFVLVENVQGLLSASGGEAFAEVLGDLAEQGFDAVWECVWARSVGAAHRRPRVFLLAGRPEALPIVEGLIGGGVPDADDGTRGSELGVQSGDPSAVVAGSGAEPVADPDGVGCGERWCEDAEGQLDRAAEGDRGGGFDWGPYEEAVRRWEWLVGPPPAPLDGRGRLSPPFVEWLMGFPSGWIDGLKRDAALHALGNAVVPQQGAFALVRLFRAFHALCASDRVW